jgi:cell wall-associated NlpC family hydrolase
MHYNKVTSNRRKNAAVCLGIAALLTAGSAFLGVSSGRAAAYADTGNSANTEVSKVVADNGSKTTTYYVATDLSSSELKDEIVDQVKEDDSRATSVSIGEDNSLDVQKTGMTEAAAESDGKTVDSEETFCEKVVDDNALDTTIVYNVKKTTKLAYKTVTRKSSALRKTTKKVTGGVKGKLVRKYSVTKTNGETTDKTLVATEKTSPKTKVVTKGTGSVTVRTGKTYTGTSGKEIAHYAKKFVGNPYVWGGTSLTRGADCSGFIYSVYRHFGLNVARIPSTAGKRVSLSNLKPGDIILYSGHFSMYIGNGKVVHAINYQYGINITSLNWGKTARSARRVVRS